MSFDLGTVTKVLLVGADGYPYEIGGATDTTGSFDLSECKKIIPYDEAGEAYQI